VAARGLELRARDASATTATKSPIAPPAADANVTDLPKSSEEMPKNTPADEPARTPSSMTASRHNDHAKAAHALSCAPAVGVQSSRECDDEWAGHQDVEGNGRPPSGVPGGVLCDPSAAKPHSGSGEHECRERDCG